MTHCVSQDVVKNAKQGFSLVEILIVVAVIAGMLGLTFAAYNTYNKRRKETATLTRLTTVESALETYHDQVGSYPTSLHELVEGPANKKSNYIPQLQESELKDGWGRELEYTRNESGYPPYSLYSLGVPGTDRPIYSRGSLEGS